MVEYTVRISEECTQWYLDGKRHREDGPAVIHTNGTRCWYFNDNRHRNDGPAIIKADGTKYWYIDGKRLTEKEFNNKDKEAYDGKVIKVAGKRYKLQEL